VALYLLGHVAFKMRVLHTVTVQRIVTAVVLLPQAPLATRLTPLSALPMLSGVVVLLVSCEMFRFATVRDSVRHSPVAPA
jgi:uncharacterized membrane protein